MSRWTRQVSEEAMAGEAGAEAEQPRGEPAKERVEPPAKPTLSRLIDETRATLSAGFNLLTFFVGVWQVNYCQLFEMIFVTTVTLVKVQPDTLTACALLVL